jgi:hypothetical protein
MSSSIVTLQRLPQTSKVEMALIELDKIEPYENLRQLSELPALCQWEFRRERIIRISETQPPKCVGELMIEGYESTLEQIPDKAGLARTRLTISTALGVHTEKGIRRQVGLMLGAFPNARPHDPEVYVTTLIYDALDLGLPDAVVAQTCQHIRRSQKFVPTVSEFLDTAENIWARWRLYERLIDRVEQRRTERIEAIETIRNVMREPAQTEEPVDDDEVPF